MNKISIKDELTEFLLYTSPKGDVKVEVILNKETVWLTQKAIAQLFGVKVPAISKHLKNIFENGELDENSVVSILETTAGAEKEFMGLSTLKNAPEGRVLKSDTIIAKNYLSEQEIKSLERTIGAFFDYIERIIEARNTFTMEQFALSVNKFLEFNEYKVLEGKGSVSAKQAEEKAFTEYDKFNKTQKIESDFDKAVKALNKKNL